MTKHVKPTKEELKAKEEEAIKAAEELEGRQQIPDDENENPEVDDTSTEEGKEDEETPEEAGGEEPTIEETPEEEPQTDPSKELYKKKFSDSARENQKIYAKNRVLNQALIDTDVIPEPTEEELVSEFKDWEIMSDTERTFAKETMISRNWRGRIKEAQDQAKKIEKWNESVDKFIGDPVTLNDNPDLEGKADKFRDFAKEESNNSVPFKILVGAFLHEQTKDVKPNKGQMFEEGSGGPNDKPQPKTGKITLEEGRKLRETNYDKWKQYVKEGKIESDL